MREESLENGLRINVKKTKTMIIRRDIKDGSKVNISVEGRPLEQVESYVYLGQLITEDGREIRRRIEIARKEFINMKNILTSRKLNIETRKRIIRCYILSTFLYALETWTIDKENWKRIEAFEMWMLRRMMKISYTEHVSNEEVLRRTNSKRTLKSEIIRRKLQYFGHVVRGERLQRRLLDGQVEGTRGRGRPRRTWMTDIKETTGKKYAECVRTVQRRERLQHILMADGYNRATIR